MNSILESTVAMRPITSDALNFKVNTVEIAYVKAIF